MAFARLEDPTGGMETVVFPKTYIKVREKLLPDTFVVITGKVSLRQREDSEIEERSILVDSLVSFIEAEIGEMAASLAQGGVSEDRAQEMGKKTVFDPNAANMVSVGQFTIIVPAKPTNEMIMRLRDIFKAAPGTSRVYLEVTSAGEQKKIATEYSINPSRDVAKKVGAIVGEENVKF
jgi:DNA polymerase III alpha subunit